MSKGLTFLKGALVALAMVGVVFPQTQLMAGEQKVQAKNVKVLAANSVLDVSLGKDGTFSGRTVDHNGNAVEGAKVVLKQGKTEVGSTTTDKNGNFSVKSLKTGVYQVSSGNTEGSYRLWSEKSAPPSAKTHGLLVMGENGARGQIGATDGSGIIMVAIGAAAIALGIVAIVIADDARNTANNAFHSP